MKNQIQPVYVGVHGGGNFLLFDPPESVEVGILPDSQSPINRCYPQLATWVEIIKIDVEKSETDTNSRIFWRLLNEIEVPVLYGTVTMTAEEYSGWTDDYPYLMNIVMIKLGLTVV